MEVRTPSDGFAATFPQGDGFYPYKLQFIAQFLARTVRWKYSPDCPGIGVALRPAKPHFTQVRSAARILGMSIFKHSPVTVPVMTAKIRRYFP